MAPIPIPEASSHLISKVLEKSGNANKGTPHNLFLISINARSYSLPHLKPTDFLTISVSGAASVPKFLTNHQ
jgi:hypothetical protein